jgi:hypothetical protein
MCLRDQHSLFTYNIVYVTKYAPDFCEELIQATICYLVYGY